MPMIRRRYNFLVVSLLHADGGESYVTVGVPFDSKMEAKFPAEGLDSLGWGFVVFPQKCQ